jgi:C4-type Zn-finger protein
MNIENKVNEVKQSLLELIELYNDCNEKLRKNEAPSTIIRKSITDKETLQTILYNTFGESMIDTENYQLKRNAKLIDNYLQD